MTYKLGQPSFAHQIEGLRRLIQYDGVYALLWEPGTGKSKTVVDYLGWLATASTQNVRVLVCCPKAVTDSWQDQMQKFMGRGVSFTATVLGGSINDKAAQMAAARESDDMQGPHVTMMIVNLETLSSRRTVSKTNTKMHSDLLLDAVKKFNPHVLVVDESHRIKGSSANAARLLARMAKHIKRRILLTGTPMPHGPMDVWAQWQVLDAGAFATNGRPWSFGRFRQKYGVLGGFAGKQVVGYQYLDDLERRMGARSMPLRKEDCMDLPPVTTIQYPVHLEPAELRAYNAIKKDMMVSLEGGATLSAPSMLIQRLRLRQATCGFLKPDDSSEVRWIGSGRLTTAMSLLEDLLATEHRIVVFAWARPEVDRLVEMINSSKSLHGAVAAGITGDTPDEERLRLRQNFAKVDDTRTVLVCQWRTVSLGINEFVAASHALFLSLSQQRDDLVQGQGRLDRQGQTRPVTFWVLNAPNTVDEVIWQAHQNRTNLEDALLRHIRGGSK